MKTASAEQITAIAFLVVLAVGAIAALAVVGTLYVIDKTEKKTDAREKRRDKQLSDAYAQVAELHTRLMGGPTFIEREIASKQASANLDRQIAYERSTRIQSDPFDPSVYVPDDLIVTPPGERPELQDLTPEALQTMRQREGQI